jgi:hypothetical protein
MACGMTKVHGQQCQISRSRAGRERAFGKRADQLATSRHPTPKSKVITSPIPTSPPLLSPILWPSFLDLDREFQHFGEYQTRRFLTLSLDENKSKIAIYESMAALFACSTLETLRTLGRDATFRQS